MIASCIFKRGLVAILVHSKAMGGHSKGSNPEVPSAVSCNHAYAYQALAACTTDLPGDLHAFGQLTQSH